jgi:flagellar hook-associated protein 1 FlgK
MSFAGITESGLSGLFAASTQLQTASHNVSNAGVDGYHRQDVVLTPNPPQLRSGFFVGTGVNVQTVRRVFDSFLDQQVRDASANTAYLDTLQLQTGQVDSALSSDQASLLPTIQSFFTALSGIAASPVSTPARQLAISNASVMADRFASLQDRLNSIRRGVEDGLTAAVTDLNAFAQQLAQINSLVQQSSLDARGLPASDLLDQRDVLVNKISGLVNATAVYRADGSVTLSIADGRALVEGTASREIGAAFNPDNPAEKAIAITLGGTTTFLKDSSVTSGRIGALLQVRNDTLNYADGQLGRLAVAITNAVNVQHRQGSDQNGNGGKDFFVDQNDIGSPTPSSRNNPNSTLTIRGAITDTAQLTGLYYALDFDGTSWRITSSDGRTITPTITPQSGSDPATYFSFEGLQLAMTGIASAGDRFDLRPTAGKAGGMVLNADIEKNSRLIAASGAVMASAASARIEGSSGATAVATVDSLSRVKAATYDFSFDGSNWTAKRGGNVIVPVTVSGGVYSFEGLSVTVGGTPTDGDVFRLSVSVAGDPKATGDGRNAQALADLQRSAGAIGGANTLAEGYSQLASTVGVQASSAKTRNDAQTALVAQLKAQQQAVSGVNLDEEAANLLRYQQAYQASSKLIAVAGKLLDSILQIN